MSDIEILEEKLLGNFYSRISIGDTFDLYFDSFWLISQNVISPDEEGLNRVISGYQPAKEAIDKEDIAKGIILTTTLRQKIAEVFLNSDLSLELSFENGVRLKFTTDTEIVDWQWAINENAQDPHIDCIVGVFEEGEIRHGNG
ncbi:MULTISPECIES: hypothetical protein [Pseudoalteromonas]|uniref:Uncharacterized protein n=1 Tax=Pseudoalteromonas luteoviolacea (strain 2ta16) TaxID=1353533 RepID=V4HP29_PSEL2|nr:MULTISPECIES: hypothetical protein [Pseudoalteromonas]ESP91528.1 hypothetical protein PL2TA16_00327 [Pseudoalteromonas luteoviolacea 2ta16]KZN40176.1 hypothetical protein N483_18475 [Pseudoalteromonas luteoviolacea NCIMB 1944]MCG7549258.1 hypothetical protein [Pseudoalteromonas sp. Of7M-16]